MTTGSATRPKKSKSGGPFATRENRAQNYTKVCKQCGEEKPLPEFRKVDRRPSNRKNPARNPKRFSASCKACLYPVSAKVADPSFKPDSPPVVKKPPKKKLSKAEKRERNARNKRRQRRRTRIKALQFLAKNGCCECGEHDPRVLEFDHIDPRKKDKAVSYLISIGYSWGAERLRKEIRKCRIICANCHRKHTIEQQNYYSHKDVRSVLDEIDREYGIA